MADSNQPHERSQPQHPPPGAAAAPPRRTGSNATSPAGARFGAAPQQRQRSSAVPPPGAGDGATPPRRRGVGATPPLVLAPRKVYLNFRGDELREGFIESLMMELGKEGIKILIERDEVKERRGQEYPFTRIEESSVALTIFSKRYTESEWCLDELVKINERATQHGLMVIQVFYNVSRNDVRSRQGEFGNNYTSTKQIYENNPEKTQKWETSLMSIAGPDGILFPENGLESALIADIVREIKRKLNMPLETTWTTDNTFKLILVVLFAIIVFRFIK